MVESWVFFCGLDKSHYHFVAASEVTSENKVTKSLFSLSVFAKTIFKNKTGKDRDSGLAYIAHLKLSTNMETCRLVKENFTKSIKFEFLFVQIFCIDSSNVDCTVY